MFQEEAPPNFYFQYFIEIYTRAAQDTCEIVDGGVVQFTPSDAGDTERTGFMFTRYLGQVKKYSFVTDIFIIFIMTVLKHSAMWPLTPLLTPLL